MKSFLSKVGKLIYRITGWTYEELPDYWVDKEVVIGFPHTSNMDTVRAFTYIKVIKVDTKVLIKSDWFFYPMSLLLNALGGIPVVRDKASGFVGNVIKEFEKRNEFSIAIVPEGTRKKTSKIKTGFWNIAKGANVPIVCWYLDNKKRETKWVGYITPSDDLTRDLLKIRDIYLKHGYLIPLGDINQYREKTTANTR
ncbi:MAG: 1-acyl-sn-glycerol-3-phosphate acyltransferase [Desulfamplus sp.]|nr:1-acyl-sn-glycerol-3-phosphate acyltransferase [Desulfamplus sp.]